MILAKLSGLQKIFAQLQAGQYLPLKKLFVKVSAVRWRDCQQISLRKSPKLLCDGTDTHRITECKFDLFLEFIYQSGNRPWIWVWTRGSTTTNIQNHIVLFYHHVYLTATFSDDVFKYATHCKDQITVLLNLKVLFFLTKVNKNADRNCLIEYLQQESSEIMSLIFLSLYYFKILRCKSTLQYD